MTEWERFNAAMKAIMSVPPETAAAIRRGEISAPEQSRGRTRKNDESERSVRSSTKSDE